MSDDPNVYEPGAAVQSGKRLEELVRRSLRLREHLWIATAAWLVPDPGRPGQRLLDRENLLVAPNIGCYVCEEPWSAREEKRRCSGKSKPGPAPLLPGGVL
jgi:hypothetical protein